MQKYDFIPNIGRLIYDGFYFFSKCNYLCIMKKSVIGKNHRLGILGGGQLGRMFIQAAINYDIHVHIMENSPEAPSSTAANSYTQGDITNFDDVLNFGRSMDVLTVEIENVNIAALKQLVARRSKSISTT